MPESAPRISEKAVEELAKRKYIFQPGTNFRQPDKAWAGVGGERRERHLLAAREDLTAILPLLCGEPKQLDDLERWMVDYEGEEGGPVETKLSWITGPDGDPTTKRPDVGEYLIRLSDAKLAAEKAEQELEQARAERDEWEHKALQLGVGYFKLATSEPGRRAERAERQRDAANREVQALTQQLSEVRAEVEKLESAGEKLAVEARHRLSEITFDNPDHPAWKGPQATALTIWNEARNSLRPDAPPADDSAILDSAPSVAGGRGCTESERVRLEDALRLLAITHFEHERLITAEDFDCTDLFEAGLVKHIEIGGTGEKSCTLTTEGMEAIQEALGLDLGTGNPSLSGDCERGEEGCERHGATDCEDCYLDALAPDKQPWTGKANIAWCPKHGLHGARDTCFECGEPVEQIPMVPLRDLETVRGTLKSLAGGPKAAPASQDRAEALLAQAEGMAQEALDALDALASTQQSSTTGNSLSREPGDREQVERCTCAPKLTAGLGHEPGCPYWRPEEVPGR
ncbi:MAG TPA: hypothetical protein VFJ76_07880 [Solirubrobacterales bacterium]|nr:hypothetical protein [Solirubrobacterales bacterium]